MALHGRKARLLLEYEKLINLEKRSNFIKISPVDTIEGIPPENYLVTFKCRGISKINEDKSPQFTEFHQVSIKLSRNFPNQEPYLKWVTPIWHPNIEHKEPHHVCTNNVQNWYSTKSLDDLVVKLGEMVQYRHYHAKWEAPFPLDKEAADWVVKYAEPKGLVSPEKPIDDRQILRPQAVRIHGGAYPKSQPIPESMPKPIPKPKSSGRLKLGSKRITQERFVENTTIINDSRKTQETENLNKEVNKTKEPNQEKPKKRITLGLRTKEVNCLLCYEIFTIPKTTEEDLEFFCENCQGYVKSTN